MLLGSFQRPFNGMPQGNRNRGSASSAAAPASKAKGKGKRGNRIERHVQTPRGSVHMANMAMKEEEEAPPPPPPPGYSDEQDDEEAPPPPPPPGYSHPAPRNAWWKDIVQRGAQQASNEDYAHQEQSAQAAHPCACTCNQISHTRRR